MKSKNWICRTWAAVMVDGVVRCVVEDVPGEGSGHRFGEVGGAKTYKMAAYDPPETGPEKHPDDDCDGPEGCYPGHPCPRCQVGAVEYWHRHEAGKTQRIYRPCNEKVRIVGRTNAADYCTHSRGHKTLEEARRCAKRGGWPLIQVFDGNWHRLEIVPSGNGEQAALFGGSHA